MNAYQQRVNAERLERQAPPVKKIVKEILDQLKTIEQSMYWSIDGEQKSGGYWPSSLIEHAHALLDLGHDYRAALAANPPPEDAESA